MSSKEHIKQVTQKYIKSKVIDTAIMINGEWGSGKTFFLTKELCPFIEEELGKKIIYISLNGLSKIDDISKEIFIKTFSKNNINLPNWVNKIKPYGIEVGKIIFDKLSISDDTVDYSAILNLKDYVLVFDDLERSLIEVKEVLGYINKFVEHESVPTIIVANENEIGSKQLIKNQEMKYYLATIDKFNFPKKDKKDIFGKPLQGDNSKLSTQDIKDRINHLFSLEVDYYHIKEKLISKTILYKPEIKEVYNHIINDYDFSEDEKKLLISNIDNIVSKFNNEKHNNLRTLQFIFENFLVLCIELREFKFINDEKNSVLQKLLEYMTVLSIKYKNGQSLPQGLEKCEYGYISLSGELFDSILGFAFINEIVLNSYIDLERMNFSINKYIEEQRKNELPANDPLNLLSSWWCKTDEEVIVLIESVKKNISNNIYKFDLYAKIIAYLITLKDIGFSIEIENVLIVMKKNIREVNFINTSTIDTYGCSVDEKYQDKFIEYINLLNKEVNGKQENVFKNKINDMLIPTENWSSNFSSYVHENEYNFLNRKRFFSLIDTTDFCNAIDKATNNDIINVRRAIDFIYKFSNIKDYYSSDLGNIEKIVLNLNEIKESKKDEFGLIKTNNLTYLIIQLNKYIKQLS